MAVSHHELEVARDGRHGAVKAERLDLMLEDEVVVANVVVLGFCWIGVLLGATSHLGPSSIVDVQVKSVLRSRVFFVLTLVELVADVPHDPEVSLHAQVAPNEFGKIRRCHRAPL